LMQNGTFYLRRRTKGVSCKWRSHSLDGWKLFRPSALVYTDVCELYFPFSELWVLVVSDFHPLVGIVVGKPSKWLYRACFLKSRVINSFF
jgi:hypothetical protein